MTEPLDLDALRAAMRRSPASYTPTEHALIAEVARLRAVVASLEALCDEYATTPDRFVSRIGMSRRLRAALIAAQDAPAPTPTEEATP